MVTYARAGRAAAAVLLTVALVAGGAAPHTGAAADWHAGAHRAGTGTAPADSAGDHAPVPNPGEELRADPADVPPEALTAGQDETTLPGHFPAEVPLPAQAALLEASYPPDEDRVAFHLYLRQAADPATAVATLAAAFRDAGFDTPQEESTENGGRLTADGHGYRVSVESRVDDDHPAVLDVTYRVTAAG